MNTTSLEIYQRPSAVEVSGAASAALAKATIEAKFVIALQRPRSVLNARQAILDACKRPRFAEGAIYRKKQGRKEENGRWVDNYVEGLSIRFAEEAVKAWRNVDVTAAVAWEDDDKRVVRITVTDLESNLSYTDDVMLAKTVERRKVKEGHEVISTRQNSSGDTVYIVRCTDDELQAKVNAAKSKSLRNSGLRLIPQDILEEAEEAVRATRDKGGSDPLAESKKIADAFASIGVSAQELEAHLGHPLIQLQKKELSELRGIYAAIRDGEASWKDYTQSEKDEIPGAEAPKPAPVPAEKPSDPQVSPQAMLQDVVLTHGFSLDDFKSWAAKNGQLKDADSLSSFDDLSDAEAKRFLRAQKGLITQLSAAKGQA